MRAAIQEDGELSVALDGKEANTVDVKAFSAFMIDSVDMAEGDVKISHSLKSNNGQKPVIYSEYHGKC